MKGQKELYDEFEKAGFFNLTDEKKEAILGICREARIPLVHFIELMKLNAPVVSPEELMKKLNEQ